MSCLWGEPAACHPSYYENPTLHIGVRWGRQLTPSKCSTFDEINLRFQDFDAIPLILTERQPPSPLPSSRAQTRDLLHRKRAIPLSSLRVIARPHSVNTEEAIHLWYIYVRFISENYPFHSQLLTRQQTTTNDYSRLQTFNQRVGLDKGCIFAAKTQTTSIWKKSNPTM